MLTNTLQNIRTSVQKCRLKHRSLSTSSCLNWKAVPRRKPRVVHDIAGLEPITYADRMYFVPGLAKPTFPPWERGWLEPNHYTSPGLEEMPLYKDKTCYIFNQKTNVQEGVRQALWLSKTVLIKGLPAQILSLAQESTNQIEDQDEKVQNAIKNSRVWSTLERRAPRESFCPSLLHNLLHICSSLQGTHPQLAKRIFAENYRIAATWRRGEDMFQVRGKNGLLLNSVQPVPVLAGKEQIQSTTDHVLETFYPIAPTIDLQCAQVYQEKNDTGFRDGYPYPHAHTLFIEETGILTKLLPEQLRAKTIMFCFGNALARARTLYGEEPQVLEKPIVVQSVATNGRLFQFVVFQLNTTELQSDDGVKNLAWVDEDQPLYDYMKIRPIIKKKVVQVPAGLSGYQPTTFQKFLALYLHGAA